MKEKLKKVAGWLGWALAALQFLIDRLPSGM
jgi:hypothetical protein